MKLKFIDKIAKEIVESDIPLHHWEIILPSERAKTYLQKALFELKKESFFAPKIQTINQWISGLTKQIIIDKTRLLIEIYDIHKNYPDDQIEKSFDEFLNWGNMLLSDFDELERYLVNSKDLFKNLKDIKDIEFWSFGEDKKLSENQQQYLAFWERLSYYYNEFQNINKLKKQSYIGKEYRFVAENIHVVFEKNKESHFLFAGFNALSKAELSIIKQLHQLGRAKVLLDADAYYYNDLNHEAGMFLRSLKNELQDKEITVTKNEILTQKKNIEVIACSQLTGQIKIAATILDNLSLEEIKETMLLLADEKLIIPLFQNIPKSVKKANITLGLPLASTSLKTWLELLFSIQESKIRYQRDVIYYKDLLSCWNHPFIQEVLDEKEKKLIFEKEKKIHQNNSIFQSLKSIKISEKVDAIISFVFLNWNNDWKLATNSIRKINQLILKNIKKTSEFERAILYQFDNSLIDFENCVCENFPEMNLRSFKKLFNQAWSKESIAYYGNPVDGLQIMGLLETRLLDFKNILIIGMNEGNLPPTNPIQSLIPMDLRKYVGLPTPREKQGLFAHHFYRLLHHCENLYITYFSGTEGFSIAEKSRFISQIELELLPQNSLIQFQKKDYTLNFKEFNEIEKKIIKTEEIIKQLDDFCLNGISASKIKAYFSCPLDFYYKYILNFGEDDKVEEEMESNTFGSIIHEVLEELYKPFLVTVDEKKPLKIKDVEQMIEIYPAIMFEKFKLHFDGDEHAFLTGKNFLSYQMAVELAGQFLKSEKEMLIKNPTKTLFILGLEEVLIHETELEINGVRKKVRFKGFIDRIDSWDGEIRVIDYKSGIVKELDVSKINPKNEIDFEDLIKLCRSSKHIFQLLTYTYLYEKVKQKLPNQSCIFSLVNSKKNPFSMEIKGYDYQNLINLFPQIMETVLSEIYDSNIPFEHSKKATYCHYC